MVYAFSGKTKGITICPDEILNYNSKKSYFDEFHEKYNVTIGNILLIILGNSLLSKLLISGEINHILINHYSF